VSGQLVSSQQSAFSDQQLYITYIIDSRKTGCRLPVPVVQGPVPCSPVDLPCAVAHGTGCGRSRWLRACTPTSGRAQGPALRGKNRPRPWRAGLTAMARPLWTLTN